MKDPRTTGHASEHRLTIDHLRAAAAGRAIGPRVGHGSARLAAHGMALVEGRPTVSPGQARSGARKQSAPNPSAEPQPPA